MPFPLTHRLAFATALSLWLGACATVPPPAPVPVVAPAPPPPPPVVPVEAEPVAPAAQQASLFTLMTQGPLGAMLAYADRVRTLNGADLTAELGRLGEPGDSPTTQMQTALVLAQTRNPADLARALGLLQRVNASAAPEARPLQPLSRALASRYLEQRRVEDDRDRQASQARDAQRRIDQLNDRLEALRAIERSVTRPGNPPVVAPANGARPPQ